MYTGISLIGRSHVSLYRLMVYIFSTAATTQIGVAYVHYVNSYYTYIYFISDKVHSTL